MDHLVELGNLQHFLAFLILVFTLGQGENVQILDDRADLAEVLESSRTQVSLQAILRYHEEGVRVHGGV